MKDKDNCLYAPDVISFAREKGYFNGVNKDFSFADAYCPLSFSGLRACEARVWSFYNMFSKTTGQAYLSYIEAKSKEPMPLYVKPDRKVSVRDIQNAMRDHYEGTALDITNDFGNNLLGKPVYLSDNMPTIASAAKAVLFGDFSGLKVNLHEDIEINVLLEHYSNQHAIGVNAWLEMDSKVAENQKIAALVMSASS